jgi:hypothetical protein
MHGEHTWLESVVPASAGILCTEFEKRLIKDRTPILNAARMGKACFQSRSRMTHLYDPLVLLDVKHPGYFNFVC